MKIDISAHIVPARLREMASRATSGRVSFIQMPVLDSLEARFRVMDKYPDVVQILSQPHSFEDAGSSKIVYELARVGNDEIAEIVSKYPDKLVGTVASIPLNDIDLAIKEAERSIKELACNGIMISAMADRPLDQPQFMALYEKMAQHDLPVMLHPMGDQRRPDYDGETESRYRMYQYKIYNSPRRRHGTLQCIPYPQLV
jgi:aminocarboxymuconate-semialdehyde decarboxylase